MMYFLIQGGLCVSESKDRDDLLPLLRFIRDAEIVEWDETSGTANPKEFAAQRYMAKLAGVNENDQPVATGAQTL